MQLLQNSKPLMLLILSLCLTLPCTAQDQRPAIETVRRLPDGNWLLKVDGELLQTINEQQKRDLLKLQIEAEGLRAEIELLRRQIADYETLASLFKQMDMARKEQIDAMKAQLDLAEQGQREAKALIEQLIKQTRRNRIESALSNPILTLAFKMAVPIAGLFR